MSLVFAVLAILVLAGAFLLASGRSLGSGRWSGMTSVERDHRPDLDGRGFDVVVRGYRMDEVDARIARLESELAQARRSARGSAAES